MTIWHYMRCVYAMSTGLMLLLLSISPPPTPLFPSSQLTHLHKMISCIPPQTMTPRPADWHSGWGCLCSAPSAVYWDGDCWSVFQITTEWKVLYISNLAACYLDIHLSAVEYITSMANQQQSQSTNGPPNITTGDQNPTNTAQTATTASTPVTVPRSHDHTPHPLWLKCIYTFPWSVAMSKWSVWH